MSFCFSRPIQYVAADLLFFILNKSLPKERIIKPTGVTTIKYTTPITRGATMEPKNKPNFIHNLFSGVKNFEFKIPKTKKIMAKIKAHNLKSPWEIKGHNDIAKKTMNLGENPLPT